MNKVLWLESDMDDDQYFSPERIFNEIYWTTQNIYDQIYKRFTDTYNKSSNKLEAVNSLNKLKDFNIERRKEQRNYIDQIKHQVIHVSESSDIDTETKKQFKSMVEEYSWGISIIEFDEDYYKELADLYRSIIPLTSSANDKQRLLFRSFFSELMEHVYEFSKTQLTIEIIDYLIEDIIRENYPDKIGDVGNSDESRLSKVKEMVYKLIEDPEYLRFGKPYFQQIDLVLQDELDLGKESVRKLRSELGLTAKNWPF